MRRVPSKVAIRMLAASGMRVTPGTLRTWVARRHITRTHAGYDPQEIVAYIDERGDRGQHAHRVAVG